MSRLPIVAGDRMLGIISTRDLYPRVVDQMETDIILPVEGLLQG